MTIRVEQSKDEGRKLSGIFVHADTAKGDWVGVSAEHGQFLRTDDPDTIIFRLTNGTLIHNHPGFVTPRVLSFSAHDLPINLPKFENFRNRGVANKMELTLPQLAVEGHDRRASEEDRVTSRANFHFRLAEVASMFLLPMLALALGVPPKRSTSALGVFLSLVILVAYHKVNQYAEGVGSLGYVNPVIALWTPFCLFAAMTIWMYHTIAFIPGGQPIGALERAFAKALAAIVRYLPGRRRATVPVNGATS